MATFEALKRADDKWELRWGWNTEFLEAFKNGVSYKHRQPVTVHSGVTNQKDFYWLVDDLVIDGVMRLAEMFFDKVTEIEPQPNGGDKITEHKSGRVTRQGGLFEQGRT